MSNRIYILIMIASLFLFSCGSKKLVFSKDGQSDNKKEEIVVGQKELRKLYDTKNYKELFDILQNITEMKDINDFLLHFLLIDSAFALNKTSKIEDYYLKSKNAFFYKGVLAFEKADYNGAIKYLKIAEEKNPIILYLIGVSYFFKEDRAMASGYLKLAQQGSDIPWPYLTYASLLEISGDTESALLFLGKALDKTYDFENNLIIDILAKKSNILFNKNDYDGASFHALQLYQKDKIKALTLTDPGDIYLAAGKTKEALDFWKKNLNDLQIPDHIKNLISSKIEVVEKMKEDESVKDRDNSR